MAIVVFSGATLPATYSCLKVGPVWPAGVAAERAELGCSAPGATYTSTAGLYVLVHVRQRDRAAWERSWSPRSHPAHHTPIPPSRRPRQQARQGQL